MAVERRPCTRQREKKLLGAMSFNCNGFDKYPSIERKLSGK